MSARQGAEERTEGADHAYVAVERTRGRSGVHARLRHETAAVHARLEGTMRLDEQLVSNDSYRALLERFYGIVTPIEANLSRFDWAADLAYPERVRAHLLAHDLVQLGHSAASLGKLPLCPHLPILPSRAAAYGQLYVLEGSTLGGRLILRTVQDRLGRGPSSGAAYFAGHGTASGAMWSSFLASLDRHVAHPEAVEEALRGALDVFAAFDLWFGEAAPALNSPGS